MRAIGKAVATMILTGGLAMPAMAQQRPGAGGGENPPPPVEDGRPNPPGPRDDRPRLRQDGPPMGRMDGRPGDGRPGQGGAVPPMGEAGNPQVRAMMGYLQLVDQYKHLTQDPTAAGVAAVVTAGDLLRPRGAQAASEYFEKLLPTVKSTPVRNAIRLQLADFYRASGNTDKALEHLGALINEAGDTPPPPPKDQKRD